MAAENLADEIAGWVQDEISRQCLGEDYGFSVTWAPAMLPGPQGPVSLPVWHVMISTRSPLLGQAPLYHMVPLGPVRPPEEGVREVVADGLRQLRALFRQVLSGANGKAKAGLPGG